MFSRKGKNSFALFLLLFAGVVVGGFIGEHLPKHSYLNWLSFGKPFGIDPPLILELGILTLKFGLSMTINMAGIIGIIIAIFIYRKI